MAAQAQRAANAAAMQRQTVMNAGAVKNRGRPQTITKVMPTANNIRGTQQQSMRPQIPGGVVLPNNFQMSNHGQYIQVQMYMKCLSTYIHKHTSTYMAQQKKNKRFSIRKNLLNSFPPIIFFI